MKTIIYILTVLIIGTTLLSNIPITDKKTEAKTIIQCIDNNPSLILMEKSAKIIKSRLLDFGFRKIDLSVNATANCIELKNKSGFDAIKMESLLTSKGEVEFYEIHDRNELLATLKEGSKLETLMEIPALEEKEFQSSGILGFCKKENIIETEKFIAKNYVCKPDQGIKFCWSEKPNEKGLYNLYVLKQDAAMNKSHIENSKISNVSKNEQPELQINFNKTGAELWQKFTRRNVDKSIAIVLNGKVLMSPKVMSEIKGGKASITGNFTKSEIKSIQVLISNESLPLNFELK